MISVAILAGGKSQRMRQNKPILPFLGEPLIGRVVRRVQALTDDLCIVTNDPESYRSIPVNITSDVFPGKGALGGVYSAFVAARNPIVAVLACDLPFINPSLLNAQVQLMESEDVDVVIPQLPSGLEPLHAVYRKAPCLNAAYQALDLGQTRIISWFGQVRVRMMTVEEMLPFDPQLLSFTNLNTPQEFSQAENQAAINKNRKSIDRGMSA